MIRNGRGVGPMPTGVFRTPGEIHIGPGVAAQVGEAARGWGRRALVVTGSGSGGGGGVENIRRSLEAAGVAGVVFEKSAGSRR